MGTGRRTILLTLAASSLATSLLAGCGSASSYRTSETDSEATGTAAIDDTVETDVADAPAELFPDVIDATATETQPGTWTFSATLSSPYDTPERYADAWRVVATDGTVLGVRELLHDHAGEQPFTRSLPGVEVPADVDTVTIEGRDQVSGWGGATVTVSLDR
jgi:hypothetical protein